ncbi:MAG TPA: hypothetical protein DDX39_02650 [Bacteroidales bacterium]|nr:MAG: hypothetical protein A2W98_03665 [Bacteroidetes bacterium GWF2_33_38]OFY84858.1 MAG: hypothetical protein A2236_09310 [Bacteroidetes bacterium RIFOXYA2_FULL_33_7]HBF87516.1 hypothetical protein [Bacteroidales bacterium]
MPETGEKYFSVFKDGNYWIYYNKNLTKKDSVYISNYENNKGKDRQEYCREWDEISFTMFSNYIGEKDSANAQYNNNMECEGGRFIISGIASYLIRMASTYDSDTLISGTTIPIFYLNSDSSLQYKDVVFHNSKYWFAPNVGLIQYVSFENLDTFYLHEYYIK